MSEASEPVPQSPAPTSAGSPWIGRSIETRIIPRGGVFCAIGQSRHEFGFLEKGILQVYAASPERGKVVLDFLFSGDWVLALENAVRGEPSRVCIEAVVASSLTVWPYDEGKAAIGPPESRARLETRLTQSALVRKQQRLLSLLTLTAAERYANLDSEFPAGWRQIPQHLLASYLAVTPQYLCRLKRTPDLRVAPAKSGEISSKKEQGLI